MDSTDVVIQETPDGWKRTGPPVIMVSRKSATHAAPVNQDDIFSIDLNHSEMVKFKSSACQHYRNVSSRVVQLMQNAEDVIMSRFMQKEGMLSLFRGHVRKLTYLYSGIQRVTECDDRNSINCDDDVCQVSRR